MRTIKKIIITGSPGTGKTTLAKALAKKLDYKYFDVYNLIKKNKLYDSYDKKNKCFVVDVKKLNKFLVKEINQYKKINKKQTKEKNKKKSIKNKKIIKGIIIDSHLSHYLPKKYVDLCIVTKCNLKELEKRLKRKKYPRNKIRENLDCEIFDICLNEAKERKHKMAIIDTTKKVNTKEIIKKQKF